MKTKPKKQTEPEEITLGEHVAKAEKATTTTIAKAPPKEKKVNKKDAELVALRRENKALRAHQQEERQLANEVQAAELDLEGAQAERTAARERLAEANKRLATFVRGEPKRDVETGKQQELMDTKPKGAKPGPLVDPTRDGAAAHKAGKLLGTNPWPKEAPERRLWDAGYLAAKWGKAPMNRAIKYGLFLQGLIDAAIEGDCLPPGEKAPSVAAVSAGGHQWLVVDAWKAGESDPARFALVQLLPKTDYVDLWRSKYGPPVAGVDASDEAKATRTAGGVDCGRMVKVGAKQFVVGPMEAAMVLTVAEVDQKAAKPPKVDHQARAANDRDDADDKDEDGDDE